MTEALFLADLNHARVGDEFTLGGDEGRHAAAVRRIRPGETILISDGAGHAIRGDVTSVDKVSVTLRVDEVLAADTPTVRYVVAQALAKGDRAELAVEMLTEVGVDRIIPWQAARSIVKWSPEREERQAGRWRATAREATKQSRRLRVPIIAAPMSTRELALFAGQAAVTLILHEGARDPLPQLSLPPEGDVLVIVGPEGGLTDAEITAFEGAGGHQVLVSDAVLRTSTAGVVAVAQAQALQHRVDKAK